MQMHKKTSGYLLIFLGLLMFCGSAILHMVNERQDRLAGENAALLLDNLEQEIHFNLGKNQSVLLYNMAGRLRIPSLGLELPVMNEWNYDLLQISPCRYSGDAKSGDLIIMGHDYDSHFGKLKKLKEGQEIYFEPKGASVPISYTVAGIETLHKTEIEKLPDSDYPLSLFTCTASGQYRLVVRCDLKE